MGKKGKVELKKKRDLYFAQKKKEKRVERKNRLKNRKPLGQDLQNLQDGLTDLIREQDAEPTPVSYFACILSVIESKPDPKRLPHFLMLLDMNMQSISEGILSRQSIKLMDTLSNIVKQYLADHLIVRKSMNCIKSLFSLLKPTRAMLQKLLSMEPNKLQADHMPLYHRVLQRALIQIHYKNPSIFDDTSVLVNFIKTTSNCLFEAPEKVANSASEIIQNVLSKSITFHIVTHQPEVVKKSLVHLEKCLKDATYRNNWDHVCDCIAKLLLRLSLCKSALGDIAEKFPEVCSVALAVDNIRMLDDFHFNTSADTAIGAVSRCLCAESILSMLPFDAFCQDPVAGRHYMLPVLRRSISHDNIAFFVKKLAPLLVQCKQRAEEALLHSKLLERKTILGIQRQIWELLPGFATFPRDLCQGTSFRIIAKELTTLFKDPDLCRIACRTFILLIEKAKYIKDYEPEEESMDEDFDDAEEDEEDEEEEEDEEREEKNPEADQDMDDVELIKHDEPEIIMDQVDELEAALPDVLKTDFCEAPPESDPIAFHMISKEQADSYLGLMSTFAKNIIPLICNAIEREEVDENRKQLMLQTLRSYASIADANVLNSVFKEVANTLQNVSMSEEDQLKNQTMMEIGCVIAEYLDEASLQVLLGFIEPLLYTQYDDYTLQKKSYKALARICKTRGAVVSRQLDSLTQLLSRSQPHVGPSSQRERIHCIMHCAVLHYENNEIEKLHNYITATLPEVILSLKEINSRTRDTAFSCLAAYAELLKVNNFTRNLLAGLAGTTPTLVSCTIITLGKMLMEYHETIDKDLKQTVIKACVAFIRHRSNEIKNAAMSMARLAIKISREDPEILECLEEQLEGMVQACVSWTSQPKIPGNTRRAVRMLIERCIKRFGMDHLRQVFPEDHMQYLFYIEKERKKEINKTLREKKLRQKSREQKFNNVFYKEEKQKIAMPGQETELDLFDDAIVKKFVSSSNQAGTILDPRKERGKDDGMHVSLSANNQLVVQSENEYKRDKRQQLLEKRMSEMKGTRRAGLETLGGDVLQKRRRNDSDDDEPAVFDAAAQAARDELRALQKRLKPEKDGQSRRSRVESDVRTGSQYRAKSGGDIKKGAIDPYAYVPLNAKYLNKRHRMKAISRVDSVNESVPKGNKAKFGGSQKKQSARKQR